MSVKMIIAAVLVVVAVWLYGAFYVVYGEGLGIDTCRKPEWSFRNTFVDYEGILMERLDAGWEGRELPIPWKVLDAINDCKLVEDPGAWSRDKTLGIAVLAVLGGGALLLAHKRKPSGRAASG